MHRLARRADGGETLLRWLAGRTGGWVGLLEPSGTVLVGNTPALDAAGSSLVTRGLDDMHARGLQTFAADDGPTRNAVFLAVDLPGGAENPVLAFVGADSVPRSLAADAATLLGTCWWAEAIRRNRQRVEDTEAGCREAVLHLLMSRQVSTARQLASALSPRLPDPVRVHVVDCGADDRAAVIRRCTELSGGMAWVVRCPVHVRQVIVIAPGSTKGLPRWGRPLEVAIASEVGGSVIGASDVVGLRDTAVAYEQAFHALAVARGRVQRWACFDSRLELAAILAPHGLQWATGLLEPLTTYVPARATDPDAHELAATVRSWLAFSTAATRHLKIHRNTLSARLRRIEELLELDLGRADQQAVLDLALRIRSTPRASGPPGPADPARVVALDDLLTMPAAQEWARNLLRPLRETAHASRHEATLRAWLDSGSRLSATAVVLGISVAAARKRCARLEQLLRRSLLHAPDARHDLWLALHAADLGRRAGHA
ncbi:DNA-binding protein [Pseudonocardia sp. MH-G8]|nr:DNA-binding protein [Pseudonocardia sp. MH-G8]